MKDQVDKLIIGLDMDGVIIDHTHPKLAIAKKFGLDLQPGQVQSDVIEKWASPELLEEIRLRLYKHPELTQRAALMDGALPAIQSLKKLGRRFFLISRRSDPDLAIGLLKKQGLWPDYFNEQNAFFVNSPEDKNQKAIELGINIYVDDQPSVLSKLTNVRERLLFDKFGNFGDLDFVHKKISGWSEFLDHIS